MLHLMMYNKSLISWPELSWFSILDSKLLRVVWIHTTIERVSQGSSSVFTPQGSLKVAITWPMMPFTSIFVMSTLLSWNSIISLGHSNAGSFCYSPVVLSPFLFICLLCLSSGANFVKGSILIDSSKAGVRDTSVQCSAVWEREIQLEMCARSLLTFSFLSFFFFFRIKCVKIVLQSC